VTKARTKAQRRRRANLISLPGGRVIRADATQGRRTDIEPKEPADLVALTSRALRTGCTVEEARDLLASEDMGRCIRAMRAGTQTRRDLLDVWQALCAAHWNFYTRCLSMKPSAQSSALPMLPEPMQTDPSLRVDIRTGDERDEAARRVWEEWRAAFNALPVAEALAIAQASRGDGPTLWDADKLAPTRHGALAVKALASLHLARGG
jgi:hypothetical protein